MHRIALTTRRFSSPSGIAWQWPSSPRLAPLRGRGFCAGELQPLGDSALCSLRLVRFVSQFLAQDFADIRLRQIVAEFDKFRYFVACEFASAELAHRARVEARIAAHDKRLD